MYCYDCKIKYSYSFWVVLLVCVSIEILRALDYVVKKSIYFTIFGTLIDLQKKRVLLTNRMSKNNRTKLNHVRNILKLSIICGFSHFNLIICYFVRF